MTTCEPSDECEQTTAQRETLAARGVWPASVALRSIRLRQSIQAPVGYMKPSLQFGSHPCSDGLDFGRIGGGIQFFIVLQKLLLVSVVETEAFD